MRLKEHHHQRCQDRLSQYLDRRYPLQRCLKMQQRHLGLQEPLEPAEEMLESVEETLEPVEETPELVEQAPEPVEEMQESSGASEHFLLLHSR